MGQATLAEASAGDLPDPKESGSEALASADDLLAQLAGQEIDRLLAENEADVGIAGTVPAQPVQETVPPAPASIQQVSIPSESQKLTIAELSEDSTSGVWRPDRV